MNSKCHAQAVSSFAIRKCLGGWFARLLVVALPLCVPSVSTAQEGYYHVYTYYEDGTTVASDTLMYRDAQGISTSISSISYYFSGQKKAEGPYANGQMNGIWTYWYLNGQMISQGNYSAGKKSGTWNEWYDTGVKRATGPYVSGAKNGVWQQWDSSGILECRFTYSGGLLHGPVTFYNPDGTKNNEGDYVNGFQNGLWVYWDENGRVSMERTYIAGETTKEVMWSYWPNGTKSFQQTDEKIGSDWFREAFCWYETGTLQSASRYKNEILHGLQEEYYPDGVKLAETRYLNGLLEGTQLSWYDNGQLKTQNSYKGGIPYGMSLGWWLNGRPWWRNPRNENGQYNGICYSWDYYGKPVSVLPYINGNINGIAQLWYYYGPESSNGVGYIGNKPVRSIMQVGPILNDVDSGRYGRWISRIEYWGGYAGETIYHDYGPPPWMPAPSYNVPETLTRDVRGYVTHADLHTPLAGASVQVGSNPAVLTDERGFYQTELYGMEFTTPVPVTASLDGFRTATIQVDLNALQYAVANLDLPPVSEATSGLPVITGVKSGSGEYFLGGADMINEFVVYVSWNEGTPGRLIFNINGTEKTFPAVPYGGTGPLNMTSDFIPSIDPNRNSFFVIAETADGKRSPLVKIPVMVIPQPVWMDPLGALFSYNFGSRYPSYSVSSLWPNPGFEMGFRQKDSPEWLWTLWSYFPFIGGANIELKETQFSLGMEYKTDGSGSVQVGGQTGFGLGDQTLTGKVKGSGKLKTVPNVGLVWQGTEASFSMEGKIEKQIGVISLIPPLAAAVQVPVVGRLLVMWTGNAFVTGSVTCNGGATFDIGTTNTVPYVTLSNGKPEWGGGVGLVMSAQINRNVEAELSGGGTYKFIGKPFPAVALDRVEAELSAKLAFVVYSFRREFEKKHTFEYKFDAPSPTALSQGLPMLSDSAPVAFLPIDRDFLNRSAYSRFAKEPVMKSAALFLSEGELSVPVIENVYPYAKPAIASRNDGSSALVFTYFDPADPTLQATEIAMIWYNGSSYSAPVLATNDTRAEFNPSTAFDEAGRAVCVWERVKNENFAGTTLEEVLPEMEIVWAAFDPAYGTWSTPQALTDNNCYDHTPLLRRGLDGSLMLMWESNTGNEWVGTAASPSTLHIAHWNSSSNAFGAVQTLTNSFADAFGFDFAWSGTESRLVYSRDMDGDPATGADVELFAMTGDGTVWSAAQRLTDNAVNDDGARVVYRSSGVPELVWHSDSNLVKLVSWSTGTTSVIRAGRSSFSFSDFQLVADAEDRLGLVWQNADEAGADLFFSVYDPVCDLWGLDQRFTSDTALEKASAVAFGAPGTVQAVFVRKETNDLTHLCHMTKELKVDLAVSSGSLSWEAIAGGYRLSCVVANQGALPAVGPSVGFYAGDPATGGTWLGSTNFFSSVIPAGGSATAVLDTAIPVASGLRLFAVADWNNQIVESNEDNNTTQIGFELPDLVVASVRVDSHGDGQAGLVALLRNDGSVAANNVTVRFYVEGQTVGEVSGLSVLAGTQAEILLPEQWEAVLFRSLPSVLSATADPDGLVSEVSEANNATEIYVVLATDADQDGMRDQWERAYFGDETHNGSDDADQDGSSNLNESLCGTNPLDPSSILSCRLNRTAGGSMRLIWATQPGVTYQPQYRDSLESGDWCNLGGLQTATGSLIEVTDSDAQAVPSRFYRIKVLTR